MFDVGGLTLKQDLGKRVLFVARSILVVALIAAVAAMRRFDSHELRRDVIELDALASLENVYVGSLADSPEVHAGLWNWLGERARELDDRRRSARGSLVAWLSKQGHTDESLHAFTGKLAHAPAEGKRFFSERITPRSELLSTAPSQRGPLESASVDALIDALEVVFAPTTVAVATTVQIPADDVQLHGDVESIELEDGAIVVRSTHVASMNEQASPGVDSVRIPVELETGDGPPLWDLFPHSGQAGPILRALAGETDRRVELRERYGLLPSSDAQQIARRGLGSAYESVSLFGFSFAPRRVPFAVLFFLVFALGALVVTAMEARRHQVGAISELPEDSVFSPVVRTNWTRFVIFVLLPPTSLGLAMPAAPLSAGERMILGISAAVLAALGLGSFAMLRRA